MATYLWVEMGLPTLLSSQSENYIRNSYLVIIVFQSQQTLYWVPKLIYGVLIHLVGLISKWCKHDLDQCV